MRLNDEIKQKLIILAIQLFGKDSKLFLFGSRVYDNKKGGDIDLFIESKHRVSIETEIEFLVKAQKHISERKIDLVVKTPFRRDKNIYKTAKKEGILLC